jgi:hypothetical protein
MPVFFSLNNQFSSGGRRPAPRSLRHARAHYVRFSNGNLQCSSHPGAIGRPILQPRGKGGCSGAEVQSSGVLILATTGHVTGYGQLALTKLADASGEIDPSPTSDGFDCAASTDHARSHGELLPSPLSRIAIWLKTISACAELCTERRRMTWETGVSGERGSGFHTPSRRRGLPRSTGPAGSCQALIERDALRPRCF